MNTNFVDVIKRIIAEQGETILANAQQMKGYVADYAAQESKAERLAFSRCIEYGAYTELKNAPDAGGRKAVKAALAQKIHSNEGMDSVLCNDALGVLEAALFGEAILCGKCGKELQKEWVACPFCGAAPGAAQEPAITASSSSTPYIAPPVKPPPQTTPHILTKQELTLRYLLVWAMVVASIVVIAYLSECAGM